MCVNAVVADEIRRIVVVDVRGAVVHADRHADMLHAIIGEQQARARHSDLGLLRELE